VEELPVLEEGELCEYLSVLEEDSHRVAVLPVQGSVVEDN